MEKSIDRDRSFRSLAVVAVLVAVVGISVAFAALSTSFNITGLVNSGNTSQNWEIVFDNLQNVETYNYAVEDSPAVLSSTNFEFAVSLFAPGDSVTYKFDVANNGTIDAIIPANGVKFIGLEAANEALVSFTLTYAGGGAVQPGDTLAAAQRKTLILTVTYDQDAEAVLDSDLALNLSVDLDFIQDNK